MPGTGWKRSKDHVFDYHFWFAASRCVRLCDTCHPQDRRLAERQAAELKWLDSCGGPEYRNCKRMNLNKGVFHLLLWENLFGRVWFDCSRNTVVVCALQAQQTSCYRWILREKDLWMCTRRLFSCQYWADITVWHGIHQMLKTSNSLVCPE